MWNQGRSQYCPTRVEDKSFNFSQLEMIKSEFKKSLVSVLLIRPIDSEKQDHLFYFLNNIWPLEINCTEWILYIILFSKLKGFFFWALSNYDIASDFNRPFKAPRKLAHYFYLSLFYKEFAFPSGLFPKIYKPTNNTLITVFYFWYLQAAKV